ncbi:hypothetical protein HCN44_001940 [Aphidius gifuensis]|uniref:Protein transport protein Sec24A n=1 Tax=Aphidius gifuensis TaxID=684658 RepID=A0A834Y242_APHGI|nr:protein transport protein Sec24A [Aphidius gifuensis]XP_044021346.1 protein transport protein Sec24A [Aphidius gifuensis]XP_044021347.1 protein transport protein Sec24A [Aphidius gifuensis]XP_044021348.1 protein transport protein Sec24A [Aphidius gifuensis]KAF7996308.1 hypothetical protein HCN44_001940 [Aphidius gifuensis]
MSQPTSSYQQPPYPDGFKANNQSMPPPSSGGFVNGQIMGMQNIQNGTQLPSSFNQTGTPSSQSSRDPSREPSRDPSPTQYLHNQYRPQLQRPPMPPINGQQPQPPQQQRLPLQSQQQQLSQQPQQQQQQQLPQSPQRQQLPPPIQQQLPPQSSQKQQMFQQPQQQQQQSSQMMPPRQFTSQGPPPRIGAVPPQTRPVLNDTKTITPQPSQNINNRPQMAPLQSMPNANQTWSNQATKETNQTTLENSGINSNTNAASPQFFQQLNQQQTQQPVRQLQTSPPFQQTPPIGIQRPYPGPPIAQNISQPPMQTQSNQFRPQQQPQQQQKPDSVGQPPRQNYPTNINGPPTQPAPPTGGSQVNLTSPQMYRPPPPNVNSLKNNLESVPLMQTPSNQQTQMQYPPGSVSSSSLPPPPMQKNNNLPPQQNYQKPMSNIPLDNIPKRYPTTYPNAYPNDMNQMTNQMKTMSVTQSGFNEIWGNQTVDLLQCRNLLPAEKVEPPKIKFNQDFFDNSNCSPDIFRCTLTKIPESNALLQKSRLPLGILIHPFKDLNHLPVIQCTTIVRCRACRTYINPFVSFVDVKRWKCNLCYRVNELPQEFLFDPVTKMSGDPSRRPEVKTSTIEFIAPSEYMLRPPQPAVYLFIFDVSRLAVESGYLKTVCKTISDELSKFPGDARTQIGFMAIDSSVHFFSMPENVSQPHELIMLDIDDVFLPCPENLIVNLHERNELVLDLLNQLSTKFIGTNDTNSALGAGLEAALKIMSATGGRISVFQTCLPNVGPGKLEPREDPNTRASKDIPHLNPSTDFYKRFALDCSAQQIAVDLFLINSQYSDLATLSGMCKFSGGCIYHLPLFRYDKPQCNITLDRMLRRYITRKIGFEAVMRTRCSRGLSIHTFHGNFFVRSMDLLTLPNVNPDAGFGMQVSIEENLSDVSSVCFQAALLYTSSKGERRIRVHTLCLPVTSNLNDIIYSADQQCIVGLIAKMAVDRAGQYSLSDARDALINVAIDVLTIFKLSSSAMVGGLMAPGNLKLLPLYIMALLKCIAFRTGTSTRLDDRLYSMCQMKSLPLTQMIQTIYPDLYPIHMLDDRGAKIIDSKKCPQPPRIHVTAEKLDFRGAFLMDAYDKIFIYIGKNIDPIFCANILGVPNYSSIPEEMYQLPELDNEDSERLRNFVFFLQEEKPYYAPMQIIRDDSPYRNIFTERLVEDRFESALSYYEFLQHLKTQIK